jgi:Putative death-receptor fusion protein (DUF2428)
MWLLMKEACGAVASAATLKGFQPKEALVSKVGQLLLSALTTLKHAGAAFAARDSLQKIATSFLLQDKDSHFPAEWASRLFDEISLNERVRNSTLRRSTGYALGFLAIMRAEVSSKSGSQEVSKSTITKILTLSLPPKSRLKHAIALLKLDDGESCVNPMFAFSTLTGACPESWVEDNKYEVCPLMAFLEFPSAWYTRTHFRRRVGVGFTP